MLTFPLDRSSLFPWGSPNTAKLLDRVTLGPQGGRWAQGMPVRCFFWMENWRHLSSLVCHHFQFSLVLSFFLGGDDSSTPPIEQIFRPAAISFQERPQTWSWGRSQHHILPSTHAAPSHWRRLGVLLVPLVHLVPLVPGKLESQHLEPRLEQLGTTNRLSILRMFSQSCQGCQGFWSLPARPKQWTNLDWHGLTPP